MNFKDFIIKIKENLPPYQKSSLDFGAYDYTRILLDDLIALLQAVDEQEFLNIGCSKEEILDDYNEQKSVILYAIKSFRNGDIIESFNTIYHSYFSTITRKNKNLFFKTVERASPMFRIRVNGSNKPYKYSEMFHIPFDNVHMVTNQRFSLSGYPCLYLGNSTYCCWEELNRPDIERCNFSIFGNNSPLNLYDLSSPNEITTPMDLHRLPLVTSCSLTLTDDAAPFKEEYIIPQAILQSLIRFKNQNPTDVHLHGIIWLSTKIGEGTYFDEKDIMYNYVIPTFNNREGNFCASLCDVFVLSDGMTYQELWLKYPHLFAETGGAGDKDYNLSVFNIIEEYLKSDKILKHSMDEDKEI